jgi:hypothetical protein
LQEPVLDLDGDGRLRRAERDAVWAALRRSLWLGGGAGGGSGGGSSSDGNDDQGVPLNRVVALYNFLLLNAPRKARLLLGQPILSLPPPPLPPAAAAAAAATPGSASQQRGKRPTLVDSFYFEGGAADRDWQLPSVRVARYVWRCGRRPYAAVRITCTLTDAVRLPRLRVHA